MDSQSPSLPWDGIVWGDQVCLLLYKRLRAVQAPKTWRQLCIKLCSQETGDASAVTCCGFPWLFYPIQEEHRKIDFKNYFLTGSGAGRVFSASPAHSLPIRLPWSASSTLPSFLQDLHVNAEICCLMVYLLNSKVTVSLQGGVIGGVSRLLSLIIQKIT